MELRHSSAACLMTVMLAACGGPPASRLEPEFESTTVYVPNTHSVAADISHETATLELEAKLWSTDAYDREGAIDEFIEIDGGQNHQQNLQLLLTDADHRIRQQTLDLIADRADPALLSFALLALDDPHPTVRQAAAEAVKEIRILESE